MGRVKIGSFRIRYAEGMERYMSYEEFYESGEQYRRSLRQEAGEGKVSLFCACCECDELPLMITQNLVIRVATNRGQANHLNACPKSEVYKQWASENKNGLLEIDEDGKLCFNITVPSGIPAAGSSSSSSAESSKSTGAKQRANVVDLVTAVSDYAWQKQTYSIKKNIKTCRQEGKKPDWNYKSFDEFIRLFFGVTAEIDVHWKQSYRHLKDLCYRSDVFFKADYKEKFLVYAKIERISDYKQERKYQYITLRMRSDKSPNKAVVRVQTDKFLREDYEDLKVRITGRTIMLAGYARHDIIKEDDGTLSHWITMINFAFIETASNGLILRHEFEKDLIDRLCKRRVLFKRSLLPLINYPFNQPTAIIERQNGKDILIDICKSGQEYAKKENAVKNNPEFEVLLYKKNTDAGQIVDEVFELFGKNNSRKEESD